MREKLIEAIQGYLEEIKSERDLRKTLRYVQLIIEKQEENNKSADYS